MSSAFSQDDMTKTKDSLNSWEKELHLLNKSQYQAVCANPGNILVSAGAGTGKTRVLSLRFLYLHERCQIPEKKIMAVTFTNKAAYEMKQRLGSFLPVKDLWIGTFHALSMVILRTNSTLVNRRKDFVVLDPSEQQGIMNKILKNTPFVKTITAKGALMKISQWKQQLDDPRYCVQSKKDLPYLQLYEAYEEQLRLSNGLDFDDLILLTTTLFQEHPQVVQEYDFRHILVDEYQDINIMQYEWLRGLKTAALFCVGDEDQAIYGWRGASVDKILDFPKDFPESQVITLEKNYRSTGCILGCASALISNNKERYGKILQSQGDHGEKVNIQGLYDTSEEAAFVAKEVMKAYENGESLSSMALLTRTGAQSREFEERFVMQHIPYTMVGNTRFYDRLEIRDALSYLRLIHCDQDNLAFERLLGTPRRGIGPAALKTFYEHVKEKGVSLEQGARLALGTSLNPSSVLWNSLNYLLQQIDHWRRESQLCSPSVLMAQILEESGYNAQWETQGIPGQARLENLKEFVKSLERFKTLQEAIEHIALLSDINNHETGPGVQIMTLHGAKGLEFDRVFLPGWEENTFPHIRALDEGGIKGLEEERRLAYVGLTRGKKYVTITFSWNRRMNQGGAMPCSPSRFIYELPKEYSSLVLKTPYGQPFSTTQQRHYSFLGKREENSQKTPMVKPTTFLNTLGKFFKNSTSSLKKEENLPCFQAGDVVTHHAFGSGIVQKQEGTMVDVVFKTCGQKTILQRFLKK